MRNRARMIVAGAAVTAALAAGGGAALAAGGGAAVASKPGAPATSASQKPMFAAGYADPSSPSSAAAARALGVSTAQLNAALVQAKLSLTVAGNVRQAPAGAKINSTKASGPAAASKPAEEQQGHAAITAAVARSLHVSVARASAALRPVFAAGQADPSSPSFAAAARALGVSTTQLATALTHAKLSLASAP
jgi:hypothetical protein